MIQRRSLRTDGHLPTSPTSSPHSELSAINRLIVAEEDGQSKGVILFQSGFYSGGEGPALEFGSWERPTSRAGPPRSRYCLSHFPPRSTTSKPIGPRRARKCILRRCPVCVQDSIVGHGRRRKQAHDEHHDWIGIRRGLCSRCGKTFTFLPPFLSALRPLQPDRPQPGAAALLPGGPLLGSCGTRGQRSGSRGRPFHIAPMVPESGFFSAAVFRICAGRCWP